MRITADEAREYFAHASQQKGACITPENLPDCDDFQYWATGGVCGIFHLIPWDNVWQGHYGVKPEVWGKTKEPALKILNAFWDAQKPAMIVGWTDEKNRAAIAFARRLGFKEHGRMVLPDQTVIMQEWRQCQLDQH